MRVSCPRCAATIPVENLNTVIMIAKCHACRTVFDFESQVTPTATSARRDARGIARRAEIPLPSGMQVHRDEPIAHPSGDYRSAPAGRGRLRIVRRWYGPEHIGLLIFSLVWIGLVLHFLSAAVFAHAGVPDMLIAGVLLVIGLLPTYAALSGLLNRTEITVDRDTLSVRHGPLPTPGTRELPAVAVRQLFVVEQRGNKGGVWYELRVVVAQGPVVALARGLTNPQQALYLERAIEDHLGIEDRPVEGQIAS
jgi:hypothetical protein